MNEKNVNNTDKSSENAEKELRISDVSKRSEQLIDLIKKAQTPKGNVVVGYLMEEYEKQKIN